MNFDRTRYKVWTWKHPFVLHWMLNPGLAINELLFGQSVPRVMLIEKDSKKSLAEKSFIPCPHCGTIHSALKWTPQNGTAFGNWFGLYCDQCSRIIPPLRNLTTLLLLAITSPVWYWFKDRWKEQWLEAQRRKFSRTLDLSPPDFVWWKDGIQWGLFMFVFTDIVGPLIFGDRITTGKLLLGIPFWIIGGLLFGLMMRALVGKRGRKSPEPST